VGRAHTAFTLPSLPHDDDDLLLNGRSTVSKTATGQQQVSNKQQGQQKFSNKQLIGAPCTSESESESRSRSRRARDKVFPDTQPRPHTALLQAVPWSTKAPPCWRSRAGRATATPSTQCAERGGPQRPQRSLVCCGGGRPWQAGFLPPPPPCLVSYSPEVWTSQNVLASPGPPPCCMQTAPSPYVAAPRRPGAKCSQSPDNFVRFFRGGATSTPIF
jgi:hypothetical protein